MEVIRLAAQPRQQTGKGVARRLRREGKLPAVLYGHGMNAPLVLDQKELEHFWHTGGTENTLLEVVIEGSSPQTINALLRETQIDPVSQHVLHVDLYQVRMDEPIRVSVPLEFVNEPEDRLKAAQAMVTPIMREVEVSCLPRDIPESITVDLTDLEIGEVIRAGDLSIPSGATLETDPDEAVVTTEAMRVEEVVEAPEEAAAEAAEAAAEEETPEEREGG